MDFHPSIPVSALPGGTGSDPALVLHRSWGNLSRDEQIRPRYDRVRLARHTCILNILSSHHIDGFLSKPFHRQALLALLAGEPFADSNL
jgi:hypothetical protein